MITPRELEQLVAQIAPPELAEEWDNVGLLLDSGARFSGTTSATVLDDILSRTRGAPSLEAVAHEG